MATFLAVPAEGVAIMCRTLRVVEMERGAPDATEHGEPPARRVITSFHPAGRGSVTFPTDSLGKMYL